MFKRLLFLSIIICLTSLHVIAQEIKILASDDYWLPDKYMRSILSGHNFNMRNRYCSPVEAFLFQKDKAYCLTFLGKFVPIDINGLEGLKEVKLQHLHNAFNLQVFDRDAFKNTEFILSKHADSLLLQVKANNKIDSVYYIRSFKNYRFEEPRTSYQNLLLYGSYQLTHEKKAQKVSFGLNKRISGHAEWNRYLIRQTGVPGTDGKFYVLLDLYHANNPAMVTKLAFIYNEEDKSWIGKPYVRNADKFTISTTGENSLLLTRI